MRKSLALAFIFLFLNLIFFAVQVTSIVSSAYALTKTTTVQVMSHANIHTIAKEPTYANIDGPISTYTSGLTRWWVMPNVQWSANDFVVWHTTTTSNLLTGLDAPVGTSRTKLPQWDFFSNMSTGRMWLVSTYKINEGEALGFVHVEYADNTLPGDPYFYGRGRIGVAYFKQGVNNNKWRYMGHVIGAYTDPINHNVQGAPYLINGAYIQVYYADFNGHIAVARTNLADLIYTAQSNQNSPPWYKYYNGNWNSVGLGGNYTVLNFDINTIMHAGAAYSTYSKKYYIAATRQRQGNNSTAVTLYESCDSTNWTKKTEFDVNTTSNLRVGWQYTTIVETDYTKWPEGKVGSSFYIYSGWEFYGNTPTDPYDAVWKRMRINLDSTDCSCGTGCGN